MKICVPSYRRYKTATTPKYIKSSILYVKESEYNDYKKNFNNEIVKVPNEITGITATRNFILEHQKGQDILMLDDDLLEFFYYEKAKRIDLRFSTIKEQEETFKHCFQIAKELNIKVFGADIVGSLFANHTFKPFSINQNINGTFLGITKHNKLKFDESFKVKEDIDFILRSWEENKQILKFNFFKFRTSHWSNKGGCVEYRTDKLEEYALSRLKKRYKNMIITGHGKNKHSTKIKWFSIWE